MSTEIITLILTMGGWAALVVAAIKWIADRAAQRLSEQWTRNRELEPERFRVMSAQSQSVLETALGAFGSGYNAAQERRLSAVESLWKGIVTIRSEFPQIGLLANILSDEEFSSLDRRPDLLRKYIPQDFDAEYTKLSINTRGMEEQRPFVGDLPWALFYAYRALHGRLLYLMESGVQSRQFVPWRQDSGVRQILASVLTADEFSTVMAGDFGDWSSTVQMLETRFLREVHAVISGEQATDMGLAQATRILKAVQESDRRLPSKV
jgi:hypothetical protein